MLDQPALLALLEALAAELEATGVRGEMFIVGGAAMALAYNTRRSTRGIDANWLNDAVKGFLPGDDPASTVLFERPGLAVRIASPRYLLAMKVMAARVERDEDDIARLAKLSGTESVAAILDPVQATYPHASRQA